MRLSVSLGRVSLALTAALSGAMLAAAPAQALGTNAALTAATAGLAAVRPQAFPAVRGSRDLGRAAARTPVHLVVGLAPRNLATLQAIVRRQATPGDALYGRSLTHAQVLNLVAPAGDRVGRVATFLTKSGFTNVHVSADNMLLTADGASAAAERAFSTELHIASLGGRPYLSSTRTAVVPSAVRADIVSIGGLNTLPAHGSLARSANRSPVFRNDGRSFSGQTRTAAASSCTSVPSVGCVLNAFGPREFQQAYDATNAPTAANTTVAIFAEGDLTQVVKDLRQQEASENLPQVPYTIVPTGAASTDTSGADEWDLDTQYSTGMANSVKSLVIYDATGLDDASLTASFDRFFSDDVAQAGSASFGGCEVLEELSGSLATDDAIFAMAAAQGQTVFASAGDTGAFCPIPVAGMNGVPAGLPFQEYPASSPYVVAVGGTTLITAATGTYSGEIGWYSGGGGPSTAESAGPWQKSALNAAEAASGIRFVPDVAMDADPNTGANVVVAGASETIGGTSLASPLALGSWARIESAHGNTLGFASIALYKEYADLKTSKNLLPTGLTLTQPIGGFHDVLIGANPLPAGPEYDVSTGLGSLDIALQDLDITK